jgi:hypothetical protein
MEAFEADPLAFEYHCQKYGGMFYPGEDPVGLASEMTTRWASSIVIASERHLGGREK